MGSPKDAKPARPKRVLLLAVSGLIVAVVGAIIHGVDRLLEAANPEKYQAMWRPMYGEENLRDYLNLYGAAEWASVGLAALLFAGCIGLLDRRRWGWWVTFLTLIAYALLWIADAFVKWDRFPALGAGSLAPLVWMLPFEAFALAVLLTRRARRMGAG